MKSICCIAVKELKLAINIGATEEERAIKQDVYCTIKLFFANPLLACTSDNLADTLCYAQLAEDLIAKFSGQNFVLVEKLAAEILQYISQSYAAAYNLHKISVKVLKYPRLAAENEGVSFYIAKLL